MRCDALATPLLFKMSYRRGIQVGTFIVKEKQETRNLVKADLLICREILSHKLFLVKEHKLYGL